MKISLATNWDPALLELAPKYPIHEVFGALSVSPFGGGRPSSALPSVPKNDAENYIAEAHSKGVKFNYLLNAPCLCNLELEKKFREEIINHIQWLDNIKVDSVTVSLPYLIELIKQHFPRLEVKVSVICHVNNLNLINFYDSLGVDVINLDFMINRDFHLLSQIKDSTSCDLEVLANESCLFQCPFRTFHFNFMGHESQTLFRRNIKSNYYLLMCTKIKLLNPKQFMMARWIRPEDIGEYESLGINRLKLSGRCAGTPWLQRVLKAYTQRKYHGNLTSLLTGMRVIQRLSNSNNVIMIDNSCLDGFLEYFKNGLCRSNCKTCDYCSQWAKKNVKVDGNSVKRILRGIDRQMHHNLSLKRSGHEIYSFI